MKLKEKIMETYSELVVTQLAKITGIQTRIVSEETMRVWMLCRPCQRKSHVDYTVADLEMHHNGRVLRRGMVFRLEGTVLILQSHEVNSYTKCPTCGETMASWAE